MSPPVAMVVGLYGCSDRRTGRVTAVGRKDGGWRSDPGHRPYSRSTRIGWSDRRWRYRLWTRWDRVPQPGQTLAFVIARTVISVPEPSNIASFATKPHGTSVEGHNSCRMASIPLVNGNHMAAQFHQKCGRAKFGRRRTF